ncbi:helix-turn-helix transcriptional regulator [Chryseobacterium sp. Hurlbut01]|jgi:DNA-binding CsgD family transcriptional regulator|uniref:helix-turn-helix transcriptional regulator n=1 Tax=Chryseobacterium sp. Hurlbut01 TaxID=1681828 RepID=UPI00067DD91C|nr:LuxR C-terminal-related transcriptional regulator [Chryseobacterium sp. Hurlbut01]KNB60089.1 LuxR family transcriptional regulator [Chryseobacterium sp. Hurlbut01]
MEDINKFFSKKNTVEDISETDEFQTSNYLEVIKAFSRITYKSIYVIDYQKKTFEYVSENPLFLCNHTPQEVETMGYAFYFRHVIKNDLELLFKINEIGFDFYEQLPVDERKLYTISYDFHIVNESKNAVLINHKLTPLFLSPEGKMWKAMCIVSLSHNYTSGNISIFKQGTDNFWKYSIPDNKWFIEEKIKLSDRESEILRLYAQGLTISEIAKKIFVTADTVKFHRRKLFDKLGVNNITEALSYAINYKLL